MGKVSSPRTPFSSLDDDQLFEVSRSPGKNSGFVYDCPKKEADELNKFKNKVVKTCWNCLSTDHAITQCPKRRNVKMVAVNKKKYSNRFNRFPRYHESIIRDITVGELSCRLRDALGSNEDDVPNFIIQMNTFGYPLGLLKKTSTTICKNDINRLANGNDSGGEEGELVENDSVYDTAGFYKYPGFNCPAEGKYKDRPYSVPGYSSKNDLSKMIKSIDAVNAEAQRIREEKNSLIDEQNNSEKSNSEEIIDAKNDSNLDNIENENSSTSAYSTADELNTDNSLLSDTYMMSTCSTPKKEDVQGVVFNSTPVFRNNTEYTRLPDLSKFAKDMGELVNFQNLPNQAGNYQCLKQTIKKIRDAGISVRSSK